MLRLALCAGLLGLSISQPLAVQATSRTFVHHEVMHYEDPYVRSSPGESTPSFSDEASFIVEFQGPPLLTGGSMASKQAGLSLLMETRNQFNLDLKRISAVHGQALIGHTFYTVFNGLTMTASQSAAAEIARLPYVKRVITDGEVVAALLPDKAAEENWMVSIAPARSSFTGEGVTVAIVDSGIDYTHPALGEGYGPGFRVFGGYDFVNNDNDPLDDNGHGTHVAGIVGANTDAFKGQAPDTRLIALKVLDQQGRGTDSAVLRAIEYALNPDGDPFTDDAVDVINISLSSLAIAGKDHPVTVAVEHAVHAGIVCVVAAGNLGEDGRASITAPGNAAGAITVGASRDRVDVAAFSSAGPSGSIKSFGTPFFGLKPDLLAPGIGIQSTWPGGAYKSLDGTSMSSPYVAGMAARLLQEYPEWTPGMIKSWLMQQATDLGKSVWEQGGGVVDDQQNRALVVSPASIDLGIIFGSDPEKVQSIPLSVTSVQDSPAGYTVRVRDGLPAGINVSLSTSTLSLGARETREITLDVRVNPSQLPALLFPEGYVGYVEIESSESMVSVPFSFFKPRRAHVLLNEPADRVMAREQVSEAFTTYEGYNNLISIFMPAGIYDIIAQFGQGQFQVIREQVELGPSVTLDINKTEAIHPLSVRLLDARGRGLQPLYFETALRGKTSGPVALNRWAPVSDQDTIAYYSSFSEAFALDLRASAFSENGDYYEIPFSIQGDIDGPLHASNDITRLRKFVYHYTFGEEVESIRFVPWNSQGASLAGAGPEHSDFTMYAPFEKSFYTTSLPDEAYTWKQFGHSIVENASSGNAKTWMQSPAVSVDDTGARLGLFDTARLIPENPVGQFDFFPGAKSIYWAGQLDNTATRFQIEGPANGGLLRGEWGEVVSNILTWTLYRGQSVIDQNTVSFSPAIVPDAQRLEITRTVEPGAYRLEIQGFSTPGAGETQAILTFRTDHADPDPPVIKQLYAQTSAEGKEELIIHLTDVCNWCSFEEARKQVQVVQFWTQAQKGSEWEGLRVTARDSLYVVSLSDAGTPEPYGIRLWAVDAFGNDMEYTFLRNGGLQSTDPVSVAMEDEEDVQGARVYGIYPNPLIDSGKIRYTLQEPTSVEIFVYDVLGRRVLDINAEHLAGTHEQTLDFSRLASGIYTISLRTNAFLHNQQVFKVR